MISNLYGDDEELDKKLNGVICRLIDDAENEFMYDFIVKDHARAERLAEIYDMDLEIDNLSDGNYEKYRNANDPSFAFYYASEMKSLNRIIQNKEEIVDEEGDIIETVYDENNSVALKDPKELVRASENLKMLTKTTMSLKPLIDANHSSMFNIPKGYEEVALEHRTRNMFYFLNREDEKIYHHEYEKIRKYGNSTPLKRAFSIIPKSTTFDVLQSRKDYLPSYAGSIIDLAQKRVQSIEDSGRIQEANQRYENFMKEVVQVSSLPYTGIKSEIQKNAIVHKLYHDFMLKDSIQDIVIPELPEYSKPNRKELDKLTQQAFQDMQQQGIKRQITQENLDTIDKLF